jgi:hypothetical protein
MTAGSDISYGNVMRDAPAGGEGGVEYIRLSHTYYCRVLSFQAYLGLFGDCYVCQSVT